MDGNTARLPAVADDAPEIGLEVVADDEDDFIETSCKRVANGVVEEKLAMRPDGVHLLEPAIARAHAGSENDKTFGVHAPNPTTEAAVAQAAWCDQSLVTPQAAANP